jgi:hypothetical protein
MGAATAARRQLAPVAVVVVRWSKDLNIIFVMFELPLLIVNSGRKYIRIFLKKNMFEKVKIHSQMTG